MEQLVLEGLQRLLWYVQAFEQKFAQEQVERFGLQEKKAHGDAGAGFEQEQRSPDQ